MRPCHLVLAVGAWSALGAVGWTLDLVRVANKPLVTGTVAEMTSLEVVVQQGGLSPTTRNIPVNEILGISYEQDPNSLKTAREHLGNGRFAEALGSLEKLDLASISRPAIRQDVEFYKAYCRAQLALSGNGEVVAAGKDMIAFVSSQKNSYHWFRANEIVGDLLVANRSFASAETYYAKVGEAPWIDYKMRANIALGKALLAQGKHAEALKSFEAVLAVKADDNLAQSQQLAATLGKARVLAAEKKADEALKLVDGVLAKINPDQADLLAQVYNAMGTAQRAAGRPREALWAFLRVDLLYSAAPEAHAEALFNLAQLWGELRRADRANEARQLLQEQYKNSPWAKEVK